MKSGKWAFALALAISAARAADLPLAIDAAQSRVDIVVKATVDSFVGRLEAYDAAITVDPETVRVTAARFAFHFADVKTGKADRDAAMHEWQATPANPDGVFVLGAITRAADGARTATGSLSFHGRAKEISFPVSVTHDGGLYAIDGDAALDTREFGLPIIRKLMLLKVDPVVRVRFHLQGAVARAASAPDQR